MDCEDLGTLYEEVGERFGIEFDYYLGEVGTVGDLYHYILWKLGLEKRDAACLCPPTFFALREQIATMFSLDPKSISLDTHLKQLIPWRGRCRNWRQLQETMNLEFPPLCDARGAVIWAGLFWSLIVYPLGLFLLILYVEEFILSTSTILLVAAFIAILASGIVIPLHFNKYFQRRFPPGCRTVGELVEYLVGMNANRLRLRFDSKLTALKAEGVEPETADSRCTYLSAFFQIRKAIAETTGHDARSIQGSTRLSEIVGRFGRRSTWRLLQFNLRWELPELVRSRFVVGVCVAGYVGILVANIRQLSDAPFIWWLIIPYAILAYLCTIPLAVHFPKDCRTVNDLAVSVVDLNYGQIAGAYDSLNSREIWASLQRLISQTASVNVDDVTLEMPLLDAVTK